MGPHKFLPKPPKRLAVVDQNSCSGCAGSPACVIRAGTTVRGRSSDRSATVASAATMSTSMIARMIR